MANKYVKQYEEAFIENYDEWSKIVSDYNKRIKEYLNKEGLTGTFNDEWFFKYNEFCVNFLNKANKEFILETYEHHELQEKLTIIFAKMIEEKYNEIKLNYIESNDPVLDVYDLLLDNKLYMR